MAASESILGPVQQDLIVVREKEWARKIAPPVFGVKLEPSFCLEGGHDGLPLGGLPWYGR